MRRRPPLSGFCLVAALAIALPSLCGCDLGTYSQRSSEYLDANPSGVKKEMKKAKDKETSLMRTGAGKVT